MSERECPGCGADLTGTHRKRKWCSERCRKAQYSTPCKSCGGPTYGGNGRGPNPPKVCAYCAATRHAERNETLVEMWEAGEPTSYIAKQLGMSENAVLAWVDRARGNGREISLRRLRNRELWPEILALRKQGLTNREIGERLDSNQASIENMIQNMRKAGIKVPYLPYRQ